MFLYPRLPHVVAEQLVKVRRSQSIEDLARVSSTEHPSAAFVPTGGTRVSLQNLTQIQNSIRILAQSSGYPAAFTIKQRQNFDAQCAALLHQQMNISPAEASKNGVWEFFSCVLLPDIVRWRFPGKLPDGTEEERFFGGIRNVFRRLWWRAYILQDNTSGNPYSILAQLGEDELVQIMERPSLAGSPRLAKSTCLVFLRTISVYSGISRMELMRDAQKQLFRLLPLISFDSIDENLLVELLEEVFDKSVNSLIKV